MFHVGKYFNPIKMEKDIINDFSSILNGHRPKISHL